MLKATGMLQLAVRALVASALCFCIAGCPSKVTDYSLNLKAEVEDGSGWATIKSGVAAREVGQSAIFSPVSAIDRNVEFVFKLSSLGFDIRAAALGGEEVVLLLDEATIASDMSPEPRKLRPKFLLVDGKTVQRAGGNGSQVLPAVIVRPSETRRINIHAEFAKLFPRGALFGVERSNNGALPSGRLILIIPIRRGSITASYRFEFSADSSNQRDSYY